MAVYQNRKGAIMTDTGEASYWLALLTAPSLGRPQTKRLIYERCLRQGRPLVSLPDEPASALALELAITLEQAAELQRACGAASQYRQQLAELATAGISLIRRDQAAYPETLTSRLGEEWLPYYLFARGDPGLATMPAATILGETEPADKVLRMARELAVVLVENEYLLANGYAQGISRSAVQAALEMGGRAIIILPLGLQRFAPSLQPLDEHIQSGHLLALSPYPPEQPYKKGLARACQVLVTATSEVIFLVSPETVPSDCPWVKDHTGWGVRIFVWDGSNADVAQAWVDAGATPFGTIKEARQALDELLGMERAASDGSKDDLAEDEPIQFHSVREAIDTLGRGGTVPEVLARRLRKMDYSTTDPQDLASDGHNGPSKGHLNTREGEQ